MASVRCKSTSLVFGRKDNRMRIIVKSKSKVSKGIVKKVDQIRFTDLGAILTRIRRVYFA